MSDLQTNYAWRHDQLVSIAWLFEQAIEIDVAALATSVASGASGNACLVRIRDNKKPR